MKPQELNLKLVTYAKTLVDKLEPIDDSSNLFSKVKNAGMKYWINQNSWKLEPILCQFVDKNGCIDIDELICTIEDSLFDSEGKLSIKMRDIIGNNETLIKILPDKIIILNKHDIEDLFQVYRLN